MFLVLCIKANAQVGPPLERAVTISFENERPDAALQRLSKEGKFTFSYSPTSIDMTQRISGSFVNKTVREVLTALFQSKLQFKEKGNYIILTRAPNQPQKKTSDEPLVISGYVINGETGEKIPEVSVYDKKTFSAAVSNQYGYFKLRIEKPSDNNAISVNKKKYIDTLINVTRDGEKFLNIQLLPEKLIVTEPLKESDLSPVPDSTINKVVVAPSEHNVALPSIQPPAKVTAREHEINMENIRDTLYRKFQVSFVPFVGTNHYLSGNIVNDYSLNILGGYSMGNRVMEFGGLFNTERGSVSKIQIAGVFNTVAKDVDGFQMAGIFNAVVGDVKGVQIAGTVNAVNGSTTGFQMAGNVNVNRRDFTGTQIAGNVNVNFSSVKGPQIAGLLNANYGASSGVQVAGLSNIQIHDYTGPQISGLLNVATHKMTGVQVAGLVNFGGVVNGTQVGLVNITDSIHGVPFGFLSLVRKGYHKIEFAADEVFYVNASFRTGVRQFYNIITAGIMPFTGNEYNTWTFGYGIGSAPRITDRFYLNFDLTSNHINKGSFTEKLSMLNKLYMGVDYQITKYFSITGGITFNAYFTKRDYTDYPELFPNYQPDFAYDDDIGDHSHLKMWWGAKVGIRFL